MGGCCVWGDGGRGAAMSSCCSPRGPVCPGGAEGPLAIRSAQSWQGSQQGDFSGQQWDEEWGEWQEQGGEWQYYERTAGGGRHPRRDGSCGDWQGPPDGWAGSGSGCGDCGFQGGHGGDRGDEWNGGRGEVWQSNRGEQQWRMGPPEQMAARAAGADASDAVRVLGWQQLDNGAERVEIEIPNGQPVNYLIGRGGQSINALQDKTKTRVQVERHVNAPVRRVRVSGAPGDCEECVRQIR
eukprot:6214780-Pleurochrysis_carterae.AAC.4